MKAYVFPGQGAQFSGMGKDLYENNSVAKEMFDKANEILGFDITKIMFSGTAEELKETKVTQPAIFFTFYYFSGLSRGKFCSRYGCWSLFRRIISPCRE